MEQYLRLDFEIDEDKVKDGVTEILRHVRPKWEAERISFKYFTEGITNTLVGGYINGRVDDMVLIRIYGAKTEDIIDREDERGNILHFGRHQCAPPLYCTFKNGLAYGYIKGVPLDEVMVRDPKIRTLVAKEMARVHSIPPRRSEGRDALRSVYDAKLQKFFSHVPSAFSDAAMQKRFTERVRPMSELVEEGKMLCKMMAELDSPLVLCHNDLLLQNIIYNEDSKKISFIDFEYAGVNYQAYDIGNHFCEYAGVGDVDFGRYPDRQYQLAWLQQYLEAWHAASGQSATSVTSSDVERLYVQVNKCALAAHFFWGVWALIQAKNSKIDFDFLGYSIMKLDEYFNLKEPFLALKYP